MLRLHGKDTALGRCWDACICVCILGRCIFSLDSLLRSHFLEVFAWTGFILGGLYDTCVPSYTDSMSGSWEHVRHEF